MRIELRSDDSVRITGYVNVVERESRAVVTPRGKVNEVIRQGTFQRALGSGSEVELKVDHDRVIGSTKKNLALVEDEIGLRADLTTDDEEVVKNAKSGKIKGWSFGFHKAKDEVEERADKLPLRRISGLVLDEVSLVIQKNPVYSATSVELRADEELDIEKRASVETTVEVFGTARECTEGVTETVDYTEFEKRLNDIRR